MEYTLQDYLKKIISKLTTHYELVKFNLKWEDATKSVEKSNLVFYLREDVQLDKEKDNLENINLENLISGKIKLIQK